MFRASVRYVAVLAIIILCPLVAETVTAQEAVAAGSWPAKPVKFVVPFPPGGSVDPLARLVGLKLNATLGRPFIIENKPGASGSIGTTAAARSPADGYTYVFVFDTHAVNPALIPDMQFDTVKDFTPVMLVGTAPLAIATQTSKPFVSFRDVVSAAKAKPESVKYGSIGNFGLAHLTLTLLQQAGAFKVLQVPYKGGSTMTLDALSGQIDLAVGSVALLAPLVKDGKLRAIATTGAMRSPVMPDVPTLAEQGFPGFSVLSWWGIFAPAGTPKPIIERFRGELLTVFKLPDVRKTLTEQLGMELTASSPEATQAFLVAEIERWRKVVREHGIKAE